MNTPEIPPMEKARSLAQNSLDRVVRHPVLSRETTNALFLKMNFLKFLAAQEISASQTGDLSPKQLDVVSSLLGQATEIRDTLVLSNSRLALSTAKKFTTTLTPHEDLTSAGFAILLGAVEFFDCAQGAAFSTYAVTSLCRKYAKLCSSERARTSGISTDDEGFLEPEDRRENSFLAHRRQAHIKASVESALDKLPFREHMIVQGCVLEERPLRDVGGDVGVTGEGARQIKLRALERLKTIFESDPLDEAL